MLSRTLQQAATDTGEPTPFVGHVGGDDFVIVCGQEQAEPLCARVVKEFDRAVVEHYDAEDVKRGYLETPDRRGELRRHPVVTVSIGVGVCSGGDQDHRAVVAAANEMKGVAKTQPGSVVMVDRRA